VKVKLGAVEYTCPSSGSVHWYEHGERHVLGLESNVAAWPVITGFGLIVNADFGTGRTTGGGAPPASIVAV
jgi:hypothetical protein